MSLANLKVSFLLSILLMSTTFSQGWLQAIKKHPRAVVWATGATLFGAVGIYPTFLGVNNLLRYKYLLAHTTSPADYKNALVHGCAAQIFMAVGVITFSIALLMASRAYVNCCVPKKKKK